MAETWGIIESRILRSRKFRPLTVNAKWLYCSLHFSPHRNATGVYTLPLVILADDLNMTPDETRVALAEVVGAGLVQYDYDESVVRVLNWERRNAPSGPQEAIGLMSKNFDTASVSPILIAAFMSFTHHILNVALGTSKGGDGWKITDIRSKMERMIFSRLEGFARHETAAFIEAVNLFDKSIFDEVFDRLWELLNQKDRRAFDTLSDTLSIPSSITMLYKEQEQEQRTETKIREQEQDQRTENREATSVKTSTGANADTPPLPSPRKSGSGGALQKGQGAAMEHMKKIGTYDEIKKDNGL